MEGHRRSANTPQTVTSVGRRNWRDRSSTDINEQDVDWRSSRRGHNTDSNARGSARPSPTVTKSPATFRGNLPAERVRSRSTDKPNSASYEQGGRGSGRRSIRSSSSNRTSSVGLPIHGPSINGQAERRGGRGPAGRPTSNLLNLTLNQKLKSLLTMSELEMMMKLQLKSDGMSEWLPNVTKSVLDLSVFIDVMMRVCSSEHYKQNATSVLLQLTKSRFPNDLTTFLSIAPHSHKSSLDFHTFFAKLLSILKKIFTVCPSNASETMGPVIASSIQAIQVIKQSSISAVQRLYEDLVEEFEQINCQRIENLASFDNNTRKQLKQEEMKDANAPPNDFHHIPITLCEADVHEHENLFLRPNKTVGKYQDVGHYLDVQFRLLREDFVAPLRDGIKEYIEKCKRIPLEDIKLSDVKLYTKVRIVGAEQTRNQGVVYQLRFDVSKLKKVQWEKSKLLMYGSLVCLSSDNYTTFGMATITTREPKALAKGIVTVRFLDPTFIDPNEVWAMIESPSYYEAYSPVLMGLKRLDHSSFPFQSNLILAEVTSQPPKYLEPYDAYQWCPIERRSIMKSKFLWRPMHEDSWPSAVDWEMDESQHKAIKAAITREMAIIQGPPGTGKTFIGLKVAEILLQNRPDSQILVICYTNHALDQFLEGILNFCPNGIIRVGGQSKSEKLEKFNLSHQRRYFSRDRELSKNYEAMIANRIEVAFVEMSYYRGLMSNCDHRLVLSEWLLSELGALPERQWTQLQEAMFYGENLTSNAIEIWLEIEGYRCAAAATAVQDRKQLQEQKHNNTVIDEDTEEMEEDVFAMEEMSKRIHDVDVCIRKISSWDKNDIGYFSFDMNFDPNLVTPERWDKFKVVLDQVQNARAMDYEEFTWVDNIWTLSMSDRWRLYKYWLVKAKEEIKKRIVELQVECERCGLMTTEFMRNRDYEALSGAKVIGMTTTGAAKNREVLQMLRPPIVIVEEAAEVLEAHIVTALTSSCQHLILIGDQQQLRPNPAVYRLVKEFNFDVSMFERLINNGVPYERLQLQHRMRPHIASLLVPHIYKDLRDHPSVEKYPNVDGMKSNVYFLDHKHEETVVDSRSRSNAFEAEMLIGLCWYLLNQGYEPNQITILATYLGQVLLLKRQLGDLGVHCTSVDNYQGEENDIILLSLVRSNSDGNVGFLKVENRVCVALSRARIGLYCVGNFTLLAKKTVIWKPIVKQLLDSDMIGPKFKLICQNHPHMVTEVGIIEDFKKVPKEGCSLPCEGELICGHKCRLRCHIKDRNHEFAKCQEPCDNVICELGHMCTGKCVHVCGICKVTVTKKCLCGHKNKMKCCENATDFTCKVQVTRECPCGHENKMKCHERVTDFKCQISVTRERPCGHKYDTLCHKPLTDYLTSKCQSTCKRQLPCGHEGTMLCHEKPTSFKCKQSCTRQLTCGHEGKMPCHENPIIFKCRQFCIRHLYCGHEGTMFCHENAMLFECKQSCTRQLPCGHEGTMFCHEKPSYFECKQSCIRQLPCGHKATMLCHEKSTLFKCIQICTRPLSCGHDEQTTCHEYRNKIHSNVTSCQSVVVLESPCGHRVKIPCFQRKTAKFHCTHPCKANLKCGHICKGNCSQCRTGRIHLKCEETCRRILICGHKCQGKCADPCLQCRSPVHHSCLHREFVLKCGQPLQPCEERCQWRCKHKFCTKLCYEQCDRDPCDEPCPKKYLCGHDCIGYCGEPCPTTCPVCNSDKFKKSSLVGEELETCKKFILLEDCGHIIDRSVMDSRMTSKDIKLVKPSCPKCGMAIRSNYRYGNVIKILMKNVDEVKKDIAKRNVKINKNIRQTLETLRKGGLQSEMSKFRHMINQRHLDNYDILFLINMVIFLNRISRDRSNLSIRSLLANPRDLVLANELDTLEKSILCLNKRSVSADVWHYCSREVIRVDYLNKVQKLASKQRLGKDVTIDKATELLSDTNSAFSKEKEETVKMLLSKVYEETFQSKFIAHKVDFVSFATFAMTID